MRRFGSGVKRIAVVGLLAMVSAGLGASPAAAAQPQVPLRVVTYNIAAGAGADQTFDPARTIAALRTLDADIIGLEEVDVHWSARSQWRDLASEIAAALDMDVFFAPIYRLDPLTPGAPHREYGIAILSRHPILYQENHDITRLSTQDPNPVPAPAPGFPEVVVNARGALVHVYATHLDYRGDPAVRQMQVADTRRIMAEDCRGGRCPQQILVGDLNARPEAPELAPLWETLTDAWQVAGAGDGFTYPATTPDRRIDYVAVAGDITVTAAAVPDTRASDHRPLVTDLLVSRGW